MVDKKCVMHGEQIPSAGNIVETQSAFVNGSIILFHCCKPLFLPCQGNFVCKLTCIKWSILSLLHISTARNNNRWQYWYCMVVTNVCAYVPVPSSLTAWPVFNAVLFTLIDQSTIIDVAPMTSPLSFFVIFPPNSVVKLTGLPNIGLCAKLTFKFYLF